MGPYPDWLKDRFGNDVPEWAKDRWGDDVSEWEEEYWYDDKDASNEDDVFLYIYKENYKKQIASGCVVISFFLFY